MDDIYDVYLQPETEYTVFNSDEVILCRKAWFVPIRLRGKKTCENAKRWSMANGFVNSSIKGDIIEDYKNKLTALRLVGFQQRREGGLAFKVITDDNFLIDMRKEEFLRAVFSGRIQDGGYIDGLYKIVNYSGANVKPIEISFLEKR